MAAAEVGLETRRRWTGRLRDQEPERQL